MELLSLIGVSMLGTVVAVGFAEGGAAYAGTELGYHPVFVGVVCATAQLVVFGILYRFGSWLAARWRWLEEQTLRVRERFERHLNESYLGLTAIGALIGTPPAIAMVILAPGFGIGATRLLTVVWLGRSLRFAVLAYAGQELFSHLFE